MIPCASPKSQYLSYKNEIDKAINKVLNGEQYILGNQVDLLEREFAEFIGTQYSLGVANGTDAIEIALRALDVGWEDEVITVSHTAVATIAAIESVGAKPVLVDIEDVFFGMDSNLLEEAITSSTKALVLVHIYGQSGELDKIRSFCESHDIFLIEDVAQAHGALYKDKRLGSHGIVSCFSCYPTKNLGAIGDGGLIATNDEQLHIKMEKIRQYGWLKKRSLIKGRNSRLDEIQAAILRIKLKNLDKDNTKRNRIADIYNPLESKNVQIPKIREFSTHVYHLYVCKVSNRDDLLKFLAKNDVFAGIHYPEPVHTQPAYKNNINISGNLGITEKISKEIISLPMFPELSLDNAFKVKSIIEEFYCK